MRNLGPLSAMVLLLASLGSAALGACADDDTVVAPGEDGGAADGTTADATAQTDATGGDDAAGDASPDVGDAGAVDRGPTAIPFDGAPNGIYWDYGSDAALYVADETHDRLVKWTDSAGFSTYAQMPAWDASAYDAAGGPPGLGQVVRLLDGTTLVTRFGYGTVGGVIVVDPQGDASVVPNLDPARRRVGLALLKNGTIVDTYFSKAPDGGAGPADSGRQGSVAKLNLAGSESNVVTGLGKPVGVVHDEGKILISDPDFGLVLETRDGGAFTPNAAASDASTDAAPPVTPFATLASPDAIAQGPDGSVFVAGPGIVYQVSRAGAVTTVATGLKTVHGVAYDGAHTRLFVSEVDPASSGGGTIHIVPID